MTAEQLERIQPYLPFEELTRPPIPKAEKKLPHFDNPMNDNQRLMEYQYQYRHGRPQALAEIFRLSYEICYKMINKETNRNRHIKDLSERQREEKASDAASYIIEMYLKESDWCITKSFIGYLYLRVQHELYYHRKVDEIVDFVDLDEFFKEGEEPESPNEEPDQEEGNMKYEFEWTPASERLPPLQERSRDWSVDCFITAINRETGNRHVMSNCFYDYKERMWYDNNEEELEDFDILAWADRLPPYEG